MNEFNDRTKEQKTASSLQAYYLKKTTQKTPHCARDHQPQETNNERKVDRGYESVEQKKRFLRSRSGGRNIPHLGTPFATGILDMKKQ